MTEINPLLIISTFFNIVCTFGISYYAYKIMRLSVTPKYTWSLKFLASLIQIVQLGWSIFYINDIQVFVSQYPPSTLVISYILAAARMGFLLAFVSRVYYLLEIKYPGIPGKNDIV